MATAEERALLAGQAQGQGFDVFEQAQRIQRGERAETRPPAEPGTGIGIIDLFTRPSRQAAAEEKRTKRETAAGELEAGRGQTLMGQLGLPEEFADDPRAESLLQGLADPELRAASLAEAQNIQAEFAVNRPFSESVQEGFRQQELDRQMNVAINAQENVLRDDYYTRVTPMVEGLQTLELALGQMRLGDAPSAFNGARLFVRQLDQSMFASDEFQAQVQQFGAEAQIANIFSWVAGGGAFDEVSRAQMVQSMTVVGEVFNATVAQMRGQAIELAENNVLQLNPENVVAMDGYANRNFPAVLEAARAETGTIIEGGRGAPDDADAGVIRHPDGSITSPVKIPGIDKVFQATIPAPTDEAP